MAYTTEELGRLIARAHYQAWRLDAPPFDLTPEELAAILPNLIKSGSADIVWHRVEPFREKYGAMAYALEAATEAQIAHNQRVEEAVVECVTRLRAYGIEPVLVKGLALTKLYPEGIVRPAGDIDLVVRQEEFAAAHAILHDSTKAPIPIAIDLKHPGIWEEVPIGKFEDRLEYIDVCDRKIRALGPSDNLQMVSFHFLRHGAVRPLWLLDIACVIHSHQYVLGRATHLEWDDVHRNWLTTACIAAHDIFGAPIAIVPYQTLPDWIIPAILRHWHIPTPMYRSPALLQLMKSPTALPRVMRERWPEPITATISTGEPFSDQNPQRLQAGVFLRRLRGQLRYRSMEGKWTIH